LSIYTYGRYEVVITQEHYEEGLGKIPGYGVLNKETGIMEHTSAVLCNAMNCARMFERQIKNIEEMGEEPSPEDFPNVSLSDLRPN